MALHMNVDKWVPALKPFWDRGMNSWRKTDLITEASTFTGLSTVDVKHWMSNYRKRIQRQEKRERTGQDSNSPRGQKRKWSGYDVYKQECIASGKSKPNTEMSKAWKNLSMESRQKYNRKASGENRTTPTTMDSEIMKAMNIIRKQINILNGSQCKGTVFMCIPPGSTNIECVGDREAQRMIQDSEKFRRIYVETFTGETMPVNSLSNLPKKMNVKDCVHNGFTCKYEEATGNNCMCPYRKFTEGVYNAITTGEGITTEYLVSQMEAVLDADEPQQQFTEYKKPMEPLPATLTSNNIIHSTTQPIPSLQQHIQQTVVVHQQPTAPQAQPTPMLTTLTPVPQLNQPPQPATPLGHPLQHTITQPQTHHVTIAQQENNGLQHTTLVHPTLVQHIPISMAHIPMSQTIPLASVVSPAPMAQPAPNVSIQASPISIQPSPVSIQPSVSIQPTPVALQPSQSISIQPPQQTVSISQQAQLNHTVITHPNIGHNTGHCQPGTPLGTVVDISKIIQQS